MVVMDDAAVGADRNIDAGLFVVLVTGRTHIDESRGLAAADALGLTGDADGAAADADFDKVRAAVREEAETFFVDDVAGTAFNGVAILALDPLERPLLPFGITFRGVDAEDICAGFDEGGDTLFVVS